MFENVKLAVEAFKQGRMLILTDDEARENEGDLVAAAELITPEIINFMTLYGRGLICLSLEESLCTQLELSLMNPVKEGRYGTAFTHSIDAREGITTGISAFDRAHTIKTAVKEGASRKDFVVPGHIFPLKAAAGGLLSRAGHTEGGIELAKLAGLKGAAVICEILSADGSMARMAELLELSRTKELPLLTMAELSSYRLFLEHAKVPSHPSQDEAHLFV